MKDLYEQFGKLYEAHCRSLGVISSGVVLIRDYSVVPARFEVQRIEMDWETGEYIWESDWYEGQACDYITSFTDEELADILEKFWHICCIMGGK